MVLVRSLCCTFFLALLSPLSNAAPGLAFAGMNGENGDNAANEGGVAYAPLEDSDDNLQRAEVLYERRGEGREVVHEALGVYRKLLASVSGDDLVLVVDRMVSLNIFEGEFLLRDDDRPARNQIFGECRDVIERVAGIPEAVDLYHYFKLACSALWVESATPLQLIGVGSYFKQYFSHFVTDDMNLRPDLDADPRKSGGGIYRIIAAVAAEPMSSMVHPALPSLEKAIAMIDLAIASPPFPGEEFSGADVYANQRTKAEILHRAGRTGEARALLEASIAEIEKRLADDDIAPVIVPETVAEIGKMREVLEKISQG